MVADCVTFAPLEVRVEEWDVVAQPWLLVDHFDLYPTAVSERPQCP